MNNEERFCVCHEPQRIIWGSPYMIPELEITESTVVESFDSKDVAEKYIDDWLHKRGARATWSDVRPIEECAQCGCDFETNKWHLAIVLTREIGDPSSSDCEKDCWYAALFCPACEQVIGKS